MQPVAIRNALIWVKCSFWICVTVVSGCHDVWAYVSMGLMYCLYTSVMSSFDWPSVVVVSASRTLRRV